MSEATLRAEQSVLGGLLLDNAARVKVNGVAANDFGHEPHQIIFRAILDELDDAGSADTTTVFGRLSRNGQAERAGGLGYLNSLASCTPSAANIARYAELVHQAGQARRRIELLEQALSAARGGGDVTAQLDRLRVLEHDVAHAVDAVPQLIRGPDFLADIEPPEYVIRPICQRGQMVGLTGLTGHGKSTVVAMAIAGCLSGRDIGGFRFRKGRVLLLAGENPENSAIQLKAALMTFGMSAADLEQLTVRRGAGKLADVGAEIFEEAAALGPHVLVVGDTSATFFSYLDENDNVQALQHAKDWRRFTELPGRPCVLVAMHPIKDATRDNLRPRGGGALFFELDGNLTLWLDGQTATLSHNKLRGPAFEPITLRYDTVSIEHEGSSEASCPRVAVPLSEIDEVRLLKDRTEKENRVLYALLRFPKGTLRELCRDAGLLTEDGTEQVSSLDLILDRLQQDRLAAKFRGKWQLTEAGKKEAERI